MLLFTTISLGVLALLRPTSATSPTRPNGYYCSGVPVPDLEQRAIFNEFVNKFYIEKNATAALVAHMSETYIQHNPNVLSGRDAAVTAFRSFNLSASNITLLNVGLDGNRGWVHTRSESEFMPPSAIVDIFRFEGSCIVEHWDVIQARPENATNPLAMW